MKLKEITIKNFKGLEDIVVSDCGKINAFLGKNNSGKSSILHAIDIGCLALSVQNWTHFQPKLAIRDLINDAGSFEIKFEYADIQYGGDAAAGIISGGITISNIVPSQKYLLWVRDRDAQPTTTPSTSSTQFKNAITREGYECLITNKREVEYYYPLVVHTEAQDGDAVKVAATTAIYNGLQDAKYRKAATLHGICVPSGKNLRKLLVAHLTDKNQLDPEIRNIIENKLIPWKREILGEA